MSAARALALWDNLPAMAVNTRARHLLLLALPLLVSPLPSSAQPALVAAPAAPVAPTGKAAWIDAFTGWASPHGGMLYARVHRGRPMPKPLPHQTSYQRLRQTIEALEVEALPRAQVAITGVPGLFRAQADPNGFLQVPLPAGLPPGPRPLTLQLEAPGWRAEPAQLLLQVYDDAPGLAVISDIDDTLTDTGVTHKLRMLKNTLLRSTWEVRTFPGAPAVLTALAGALPPSPVSRPVFFVSGSPWGLHSRLSDFFSRSGFPRAALLLRRYSQESLDGYAFKLPHLRALLAAFPHKRWVLLGDSGEKDPEVYRQLRSERAAAIAATYIHLVTPEPATSPRFSDTMPFTEWSAVQRDAQARGLLGDAGGGSGAPGSP